MERKLRAGVLASTGAVGQNYIHLLRDHPWFDITFLTASEENVGKQYVEAVKKRKWFMPKDIPSSVEGLVVSNTNDVSKALNDCDFVFSALDKEIAKEFEHMYAKAGLPVVSNASAYRWDPLVPMIIPEINHNHLSIIDMQKKQKGYDTGFICVKPNCSIQSFMTPIYALMNYGLKADKMVVSTFQAASGAGRPGVPSMDLIDNFVPYIPGEKEKTEKEPLKILGKIGENGIENYQDLKISARCTRIPVSDGHTAVVNFSFANGRKPNIEEMIQIWQSFKSEPQRLDLPFAPKRPIIYRTEEDRPQPKLDRDSENGMAITVGGLMPCSIFGYTFVGLSHNTVRGAAGGAILTTEMLCEKGYINPR